MWLTHSRSGSYSLGYGPRNAQGRQVIMFVKNTWYVAAWSNEVEAEGLFSRTIIGVPLLIYRKSDGGIVAMEDRCCHRGAPLSIGRREGDCIRCMYHGLKYDAAGQCVEAPAQERIPPQARVRTFPVVERHRWICVWMGRAELADTSLIPRYPVAGRSELAQPGRLSALRRQLPADLRQSSGFLACVLRASEHHRRRGRLRCDSAENRAPQGWTSHHPLDLEHRPAALCRGFKELGRQN